MSEYVDVDIIENGKVIGTTKILKKTEEPEEQKIKLEKVDDKTAYENLLVKFAELEADNRLLEQRGSDILKELLDKNKRYKELERQIEKMKCCQNCRWEEPSSFCDNCKRLEGQIFADTLTSDNWEIKENV